MASGPGILKPEEAGDTLVVNFWVPLVRATAANGCMQVMCGSHRFGLLPHNYRISIYKGVADANLPPCETVTCEVNAGDVLMTMGTAIAPIDSQHVEYRPLECRYALQPYWSAHRS